MAKIIGAHSIIYSTNADADRAFFRDVIRATSVDIGGGWLIFGLPPAEVAVHPSIQNDKHEFYLMCDDVDSFVEDMDGRGIACSPVEDQGWGRLTEVTLPGGGKLGVYEPRHARPKVMPLAPAKRARKPPKTKKAVRARKPPTKKKAAHSPRRASRRARKK